MHRLLPRTAVCCKATPAAAGAGQLTEITDKKERSLSDVWDGHGPFQSHELYWQAFGKEGRGERGWGDVWGGNGRFQSHEHYWQPLGTEGMLWREGWGGGVWGGNGPFQSHEHYWQAFGKEGRLGREGGGAFGAEMDHLKVMSITGSLSERTEGCGGRGVGGGCNMWGGNGPFQSHEHYRQARFIFG